MDRRKIFRDSEKLRTRAKQDERRLNMRFAGDLHGSLRLGLNDIESERRKILADLDKTKSRTARFSEKKRGDPYLRDSSLSKYTQGGVMNSHGTSNRLPMSARFRGSEYAERRRNITTNEPKHEEAYKRVQEGIKNFNMAAKDGFKMATVDGRRESELFSNKRFDSHDFIDGNNNSKGSNDSRELSKTNEPLPLLKNGLSREFSVSKINFSHAKNKVAKRLARTPSTEALSDGVIGELSQKNIQLLHQRKSTDKFPDYRGLQSVDEGGSGYSRNPIVINPVLLNPDSYGPDGKLRAMHAIPNFEKSYSEAKKAKYLRHGSNFKPDYEIELSVTEIFDK